MTVTIPDQAEARARFRRLLNELEPGLRELLACPPHSRDRKSGAPHIPVPSTAGVYLFSENGEHRYVGRARNLNRRFGQHVAPKSRHNQAAFAFNIAKREAEGAGFVAADVKRGALDANPAFNARFFTPAKSLVRSMEFRFVLFDGDAPDADALSTVFEVYASMRLGTEGDFNLFATH